MTELPEKYVGGGVPRKEDPALVTGRANWTDNTKLPGMLHATMLRSPFAHAKINYTLERTVTPSPTNVMGVKGVGEAGTIGSSPAVINSLSPYGTTQIGMPASPWKVWQAIQDSQGREAGTRDADRSGRPAQGTGSPDAMDPGVGSPDPEETNGGERT